MRRICCAICAITIIGVSTGTRAADLAIAPGPIAPAPAWSWSGFYSGVHLGNGWGNETWQSGAGPLAQERFDPFIGRGSGNGPVGGGQVGWNYQTGPWVLGAEAALSAANINTIAGCGAGQFSCTTNIDRLGTFTGRLGFAFDRFQIYGKGGAAVARTHFGMAPFVSKSNPDRQGDEDEDDEEDEGEGENGVPVHRNSRFTGSATQWGWTAGVGIEFAFGPALSAFAEYDILDFANHSFAVTDQDGATASISKSQSVQLLKLGLNYRLGQASVPWNAGAIAWPGFASSSPGNYNWTGVYVGGQIGGGWGQTGWNSATGEFGSRATNMFAGDGTANGFVVGGQIGANYQLGAWVTGVEADANWADLDSNAKCSTPEEDEASGFTCHTRIDALGTLTGRLGLTFGNLLVYGKGGAAWDRERHQAVPGQVGPINIYSGDETRWGWTVGLGLEYALTPAWTGKVEYDYMEFGNKTIAFSDGLGNASNVGLSQNLNVVKMGFNYKLGADPTASFAGAASLPLWVKAPVLKAPQASDWSIEAGPRYWVSSGRKQLDLAAPGNANQLNSRLIFDGTIGQAAEAFARLDHRNGMFLKGNFGLGNLAKGQFNDEDTPTDEEDYSNTVSSQRDGRMLYGSLDVGHAVVTGPGGDVGAYVGYRYLYERNNAFGIFQLAHADPAGTQPTSQLVISETEAWSGVALGLNTRVQLADRWRLQVDAAVLPFVSMWGFDNHWNRPEISPGAEQGQGWGSQIEAILSYALTDQWSIGAGGRYWYFATSSAHTQFAGGEPSPMKFYSERYGGFLQATYKFDGVSGAAHAYTAPPMPVSWTGYYVGGNLGAGFGRSAWSDPFGPTSIGDQDRLGGALAGGQVGANYQSGMVVYGAEAAGSWAELTGSATCFAGNPNGVIAGQDCTTRVGALATFTGRVGLAADRTLYYAKAGPAWGHSTFGLNFAGAAPGQVATVEANRWGWTVGAGIEQALTREWSIVGEYKYVDLGSTAVSFGNAPASIAQAASPSINQHYQMLTLGVNYKLN
jgi:opacity protein-like surface antigen